MITGGLRLTVGAALLAASVVVPGTAHAETTCTTTELPVPSDVYVAGLTGAGNGRIATHSWYDEAQAVWQNDVPHTVTFPQERLINGINSSGVLATSTETAAWRDEESLQPLPGKTKSFAWAINDGGEVLGHSGSTLVVWPADSTTPRPLSGTGNGWWWSPRGIDDDGNAIGYVIAPGSKDTGYVWNRQGDRTELQLPPGDYEAQPLLIHGGRVFGMSMPENDWSQTRWVEWNLQGQVVRLHDGDVRGANDAGDLLTNRRQGPEVWVNGVLRADGRFDVLPEEVQPQVLTENGDVYGFVYTQGSGRVVKVSCG
ncbi:hypothetical protein PV646_01710 [Streptomyces sp. ID05-26A]|nr:hypothetical protein [Streptomyces sp. ID05-26A]